MTSGSSTSVSELIEAAARAEYTMELRVDPVSDSYMDWDDLCRMYPVYVKVLRSRCEACLRSLSDDPQFLEKLCALKDGRAWIAPNEATDAMYDAGTHICAMDCHLGGQVNTIYSAMRSAHLNSPDTTADIVHGAGPNQS